MAIASASCLVLSMESIGGNVSGVMAYLNGSRIKKFFTVRLVLVKMLSTTLLMCTSSPGGKEGPMIHMGAAIGNLIPTYAARIYFSPALNHLCSVYERRDMSVCGIAAGIAAGFGAPFGAVFLALEETTTYYSADLYHRMIVCSFLCKICCNLLSVLSDSHHGGTGIYKLMPHLNVNLDRVSEVEWVELGVVVLYGVIGAFLGVIFILLSKKHQSLRKKFALGDKKLYLFSEALANAFIVSTFVVIMLWTFSNQCFPSHNKSVPRLACPKNQVPIPAVFMITFEQGYKSVMEALPKLFPIKMLLIYFIFFYFFCILSTSHAYSSGFFTIHFLVGALWGRLLGEGISWYWGPQKWMDPRKFALIGAGSQISAIVRSQVCIVCLLLESGDVFESCGLQIFVATIIAKFVANFFVPSIYHVQLDLMGVPFLEYETPRGKVERM
uniref:Chloride channel protein B n=2 Tax=Cacopsylla melanoneura TaxID=428564 RepID=A0A8D9B0V2_9HEMI